MHDSIVKIITCAVILFFSVCFLTQTLEDYVNHYQKDIQVVVARYKEDLHFLKDGEFDEFDVIIYNKGQPIKDPELQTYEIINLPNIGKIDHTILYHIIKNYDNLHETTLFIPGSFQDHRWKKDHVESIFKILNKNEDIDSALLPIYLEGPVGDVMYDFHMDKWETSSSMNKDPQVDNDMLLSPIRPFGKWYRSVFGNKKVNHLSYYGIFAVSREEILKNPREKYIEIIKFVDSHPNPEAGHYIERSWTSLFM